MRSTIGHSKILAGLPLAAVLAWGCWLINSRAPGGSSSRPHTPTKQEPTQTSNQIPLTTAQPAAQSNRQSTTQTAATAVIAPSLPAQAAKTSDKAAAKYARLERKPYDQPGEAARYRAERRLPEGETALPVERYLKAVEQMRALPQYSTRQNRLLPSRNEALQSAMTRAELAALEGWNLLGPGNVGGRTRALLINPKQPEVMYAAAASGGVWKTIDGGRSWQPVADLLPNLAFNALAFDPANADVIYAGTGEGYFNEDAKRGAGIFRSFDGGATWRRLDGTGTPDFHFVNDIVISQSNRNRIYAATRSGVMRSLDGGVTWTRVLNPAVNGGCLDLAMRTDQPTDVVFAACGTAIGTSTTATVLASIYRNLNAGALGAWEEVYSEAGMGRTSLAIAPSNQNVIYAASAESGAAGAPHSLHDVFRSTSGGDSGTWTSQVGSATKKLNAALFSNPIYALYNECRGQPSVAIHQGWFNNTIAVDPANENTVWVGGVDLFRSDDGGVNWGMASFWHLQPTDPHYAHADQHAIVFHPQFDGSNNRTLFIANDGGLYRTDNARGQTATGDRAPCSSSMSRVTWTSLNNGYAVTQFYHGAAFPDGRSYLGGAQDNGVVFGADDNGVNGWRETLSGDGGYVAIDPNNPNIVYAETYWLSLKKSVDGGKTFRDATSGIANTGFKFITPFVMDPSDAQRLWIGGANLWRTRNGATTWSRASGVLSGATTAIAVAPTDANFVLAGTDQGYIHRTTTGLNTDGDSYWPVTRPRTGTVSWLTFDPANRDIAYATYANFGGKHVYRSQDGGASWTAIDGVLPDVPVNCILVDPSNTQRLYIGTDAGVFASPDGGQTWAVENTGFANVPVETLAINQVSGIAHLFAFTHGRGAWRVPLSLVCNSTLSAANQTFVSAGGSGNVNVTMTNSQCQWSVESNASWITIASDTNGRGNAALAFNVAPNSDTKPRTGTITAAGKSVSILQAGVTVSVSAASLRGQVLAPESIVSAYGEGLATAVQAAEGNQLPTTIAGTVVTVKDSAGTERRAPLFFVSPHQVNYLIPAGTAVGPATVMITNGNDGLFSGAVQIANVAPGLFTISASGQGIVVGQALRVRADGRQSYEPLAVWNAAQNRFIAHPIDLGPDGDQVFLILYGTGLRFHSGLANVNIRLGGATVPALFASAQGGFAGLDQINLQVPRALAGRGEVDLVLVVDGQSSNVVRVSIK